MKAYRRFVLLLVFAILAVSPFACKPSDGSPIDSARVEYYENGQKEYEKHYTNGKQDGLETYWYQNGQRLLEVHWMDGEKDGLEAWWDEDGTKILEVQYQNGERVNTEEF